MATTAEGVETEGQLERLVSKGCTEIQGYFYSKAVPSSEVLTLIETVDGKSN
jgi:EAL domain-containing protein (putative c-di-GMP-specific phosphodiesterase class I)